MSLTQKDYGLAAVASQPQICIIDDGASNLAVLTKILAHAGLSNVRTFPGGRDFLTAFASLDPDLILLDVHMPGVDGFEVLTELRARQDPSDFLPVLVLTADDDAEVLSRALALGATDFLTKPFHIEEAILRVRNLLETRRLHRALRQENTALLSEIVARTNELQEFEGIWTTLSRSLATVAEIGVEPMAQRLCDELAKLPDLTVVTIHSIEPSGVVVPVGHHGEAAFRARVNTPVREPIAGFIRDHLFEGGWLGEWPAASFVDGPWSGAIVPLRVGETTFGALIAATQGADATARLSRHRPALDAFAALAAAMLAPAMSVRQDREAVRLQINTIIETGAFALVFQPIVDLVSGQTVGFEALTRFADGTPPDRRFAEATEVGLGNELESACIKAAMTGAVVLPNGCRLTLNASPALILANGHLRSAIGPTRLPIVLEITEHAPIEDYVAFRQAITDLGPDVSFAIDDAGAGYSSLRHVVELRPAYVKLDIALVRAIEHDQTRQALVAGMVYFAQQTGCALIAEGIETVPELDTLRTLGVSLGQGYLLGRPGPLPTPTPII